MLILRNIIILICSINLGFALSITPSGAIDDMTSVQEKGNGYINNQKTEFTNISNLIQKSSYVSTSYLVFLIQQRNKLIHNDFKIESLKESEYE